MDEISHPCEGFEMTWVGVCGIRNDVFTLRRRISQRPRRPRLKSGRTDPRTRLLRDDAEEIS